MFKGKLKKIEEQIIEIKGQINLNKNNDVSLQCGGGKSPYVELENERLSDELDKLETQRNFLLDRRESWMPKTIWNVIVPIVVTIITLYIVKLLEINKLQ